MRLKDRSPKNTVIWCLRLKKGIKLEEPNDNLCKVYIKKARSSLNMLDSAIEKKEVDWIATTAYYSRYFAFYALLQKCGIKSEIHDCSISLMDFLFVREGIIEEDFYKELLEAKGLRVDIQYYVTEELDKEKLKRDADTANDFVIKMEEVIENISKDKIDGVREKLRNEIRKIGKKRSKRI